MRRFYTAAEQRERADFWHTAADDDEYGEKIYRGIVFDDPDTLNPLPDDDVNLAQHILDRMQQYGGGLGTWWTQDREEAESSYADFYPGSHSVLISGEWNPLQGEDESSREEEERSGWKDISRHRALQNGTPVKINGLSFRHGDEDGSWRELPLGPIERTASRHTAAIPRKPIEVYRGMRVHPDYLPDLPADKSLWADHILNSLGGVGEWWSTSPYAAETYSSYEPKLDSPGSHGLRMKALWTPGPDDDVPDDFDENDEIVIPEGSDLQISSLKFRPSRPDDEDNYYADIPDEEDSWEELLRRPVSHFSHLSRTAGRPADLEWRHNLDGTGPEWELIATPPTGRTQVVQTENSGHQHYGASSFTCPPGQPGCVSAMGVPDPDNTQMGPKGKRPTAEDYAEPWDANPTAPDYTDYSGYSGVGGGGTGGGGSWGGGGGGGIGPGGIMEISQPLYQRLKTINPDATIGGYREDSYGEHANGSLDYMTTDPGEAARAIQMGFDAGAPWAIWNNQMHYPDGRVTPYNGPQDTATLRHEDHVHTGPLQGNF